jgi:hypothetical protein
MHIFSQRRYLGNPQNFSQNQSPCDQQTFSQNQKLWSQPNLGRLSGLLKLTQDWERIMSEVRGERLQVMLSPEELALLDDFRFKHRMPSRAAAIRELLKFGLATTGVDGSAGVKSSNYGVFSRGPDSHRVTKDSPGTE